MPYSVNEIYEIKTSGKQHSFKPIYKSDNHIYYIGNGTIKGEYEYIYNGLCNLENNKVIDYVYLRNLISLMAKLIILWQV